MPNNLAQRAAEPMTRDEIVELMARTLAKEDRIEICSDATYRHSTYGPRASATLRALEAAGCQIVQGEPVAWRYEHPAFGIGLYSSRQELKRMSTDTTEDPLFAGKVQP